MRTATPTIDDLITRGIPGGIVVASFFISTAGTESSVPSSNFALISFLAISYTVGTFLDLHKHDFFTAPPHFRRVLYGETGNRDYLRGITRFGLWWRESRAVEHINRTPLFPNISQSLDVAEESPFSENNHSLKEVLENREGVEVSPDQLTDVWIELERVALPKLGRVGENQHTVYHFLLNFFLSITISIVLLIYGTLVRDSVSALVVLIFGLSLFAILVIQINLSGRYSTRYSKQLLGLYHAKSEEESDTHQARTVVAS